MPNLFIWPAYSLTSRFESQFSSIFQDSSFSPGGASPEFVLEVDPAYYYVCYLPRFTHLYCLIYLFGQPTPLLPGLKVNIQGFIIFTFIIAWWYQQPTAPGKVPMLLVTVFGIPCKLSLTILVVWSVYQATGGFCVFKTVIFMGGFLESHFHLVVPARNLD